MSNRPSKYEALFAMLSGVAAVAGSYAVAGYTRSFVVAPIDALVVNLTPGPIVTFMIENVGEAGHLLHIALSIATAVGLFSALSLVGRRITDRLDSVVAGSATVGVLGWGIAAAITGEFVLATGAAIPVAVFTAVSHLSLPSREHDPDRRRVLGTVAGSILFAGTAVGIGSVFSQDTELADAPGTEGVESRLDEGERKSIDIAGDLPGLVSSIDGFYNVDIAEFDPEIAADDWSLTFTGAATEDEMTVTYDDLVDMPKENRFVTLRCVGEGLNGKKLDTAVWTGTPIAPLLEEVDPDGECDCVMLHGEDGYFVQYPVEVLENGFLAWGMNGKELPPAHGHPVRVLIPGHWGETNVKWLTEIELLDEEMDGYWERRGWEGTGTVKTVAKLWDEGISALGDGRTELAGHAYAGTRGISRVEVSTDGGENWNDATLSERLPDEDVWRQWRYTFEPSGTHEVVVRAIDDDGNVQTQSESDPSPTGASGWVHRTVSP